ncbi:DUF2750 domain-containing protein [Streptomyces sp. NBC_00210]|uniref:DUF2750 domain-containing protein n=1 Tax=unclassified Streptomyces TaxID=2593676 RepID=UPI003255E964
MRDDEGSPAPLAADGTRSLPYWSTSARAAQAAKIWGNGLRVESMSLDAWRDSELTTAAGEGLLIGVNWSGPRLVGWSFTPVEVLRRLAAADKLSHSLGRAHSRRQQMSAHPRVRNA